MTEQTQSPQDSPERQDSAVTSDVTQGTPDDQAEPARTGDTGATGESGRPDDPTVTPEQDDPDREGEDRFDAG